MYFSDVRSTRSHPTKNGYFHVYAAWGRHLFLISFLLVWYGESLAQNSRINGVVKDQTGQPVPYAQIRMEGAPYGAVSNTEGEFSLGFSSLEKFTANILVVSCIGYATRRLRIADIQPDQPLILHLDPQPYALQSINIYATNLSAQEMLRTAFNKIPDNYARKPYHLQTFYRHYCKEGGIYGRLIEAAIELYDPKGHPRQYKGPAQKLEVKLHQLRRSFDYTRLSSVRHLPIALYQTLQQDFVSYRTVLSQNLTDRKFRFSYADTTYFDGEVVYVIAYSGRQKTRRFQGKVFLSVSDMAILSVDEQVTSYRQSKGNRYTTTRHYLTSYKKYNGAYYLNHLLHEGTSLDQRLDSAGKVVTSQDHAYHVEMMVNSIDTQGIPIKGKEPTASQMQNLTYNPGFWETYNVLEATPLEQQIAEDLENRMPLETQFEAFDTQNLNPDIHDRLNGERLARMLKDNRGNLILMCFWDSSFRPGLRDILVARKLAKAYQENPVTLIFISVDTDQKTWETAIKKKKLYMGHHLRLGKGLTSPIAKKYGAVSAPYFILLDRKGDQILRGDKLPSHAQIEKQLQAITNP